MEHHGENGAKKPPINISVEMPVLPQNRYAFSTFIDRDCDPKELNAVLDKITRAGKRMQAFAERKIHEETLEKEMADYEKAIRLRAQKDELDHMEWEKRGKRGEFERRGTEAVNWENLGKAIETNKANIKKVKEMIAECDELMRD